MGWKQEKVEDGFVVDKVGVRDGEGRTAAASSVELVPWSRAGADPSRRPTMSFLGEAAAETTGTAVTGVSPPRPPSSRTVLRSPSFRVVRGSGSCHPLAIRSSRPLLRPPSRRHSPPPVSVGWARPSHRRRTSDRCTSTRTSSPCPRLRESSPSPSRDRTVLSPLPRHSRLHALWQRLGPRR